MTVQDHPIRATSSLARTIVGHRVPSSELDAWPERPLEERAWSALTAEVSTHRIWTSLADAIAAGHLPATDDQCAEAVRHEEAAVLACLHLDRTLRDVWGQFREQGIEARVFKGVSSAMLVHPEPRLRTYSDVDLLVPGADFEKATSVLMAMGGRRHNPDPRKGFIAALGKSAGFTLDGGWEVDLHRSPQGGPFGAAVPTRELFAHASHIVVGGETIAALSRTHLFITACYHAVLPSDDRRLVPFLDVAHMMASERLDEDDVITTAGRWRGTAVVAAAVEIAAQLFALPADVALLDWAGTVRPPSMESRWLRACTDDRPRSALVVGAFTATAYRERSDGLRYLGAQVFHDARQPVVVRARRLGRRLVSRRRGAPMASPHAPSVVRPRLGFIGFHSDGTGRDPLSQSELVATALAHEGFLVRTSSTRRPAAQRLLDQARSVVAWRGEVDSILIDVFSGRSFVSAEVAARLSRAIGVPYVLVLHGGNLPTFIGEHPRRVEALCAGAARLVAPSDYLADAFRNHGYDVQVIPNLVRPPVDAPRVRSHVDPTLLWMRTFERTYQPDLAVRTLERVLADLPGATMTMAGADRGELQQTIDLATGLGLSGSIEFAGFVRGPDKTRLFEEQDIFLNTTSIDNTPVSVLEAAAAGLPVVATRVGGIGVLLRDGQTGLLADDGDPQQLADAVIRLCADPELAGALSSAGLDLAADFAWPRVSRSWNRLFVDMGLPTRLAPPEDGVATPLALLDLPRVAEVHLAAFTDSQLSVLGSGAVERYYRWQFLGPHENHAFGVWSGGELVGFVFGGRYRGALQGFLHRNWLALGWDVARQPGNLFGPTFRARLRHGATVFTGRHRTVRPTGSTSAPVSSRSFGILAIAVDPEAQGSGVAATLLRAAEEAARVGDFDGMHLSVSTDNPRAIAFYEREGWVRAPNLDGSWTGSMRYQLGAEDPPSSGVIDDDAGVTS